MSIKVDKKVDYSHHFTSQHQEHEAGKEGIWLFLATEILMFGGLFVAYAIFRAKYPEAFQLGSSLLSVPMGAFNTVVLITSSFTMALAVHHTQKGDIQRALPNLTNTFLLAGVFMVVKYFEYTGKINSGLLPGGYFSAEMANMNPQLPLFFGLYFVMTGLHGIHILVGMGLIAWLMKRMHRGDFNENFFTPVEGVGLYWHIVDIIWIYLFPLMYLLA